MPAEFLECAVEVEEIRLEGGFGYRHPRLEGYPDGIAATLLGCAAPGVVDQDVAHRTGDEGAELRGLEGLELGPPADPQIGFVDEGRGLEGVSRPFVAEVIARYLPEFGIE